MGSIAETIEPLIFCFAVVFGGGVILWELWTGSETDEYPGEDEHDGVW